MRVEVVLCPAPGQVQRVVLELPPGATVADALGASGLPVGEAGFGVWGKKRAGDTPLREADRVEIYRPLTVDPKEARRQRYKRQRAR